MKLRQCFKRLCYSFNVKSSGLNDFIPERSLHYGTRFSLLLSFKARIEFFSNLCLPSTVNEKDNLDHMIELSELYLTFRKRLLNLIRPTSNETCRVHHPTELVLLARLRLGLRHKLPIINLIITLEAALTDFIHTV